MAQTKEKKKEEGLENKSVTTRKVKARYNKEAFNLRKLRRRLNEYKEFSEMNKELFPTWKHALRFKNRDRLSSKIWWNATHTKFNVEQLSIGERIVGVGARSYNASYDFGECVTMSIIKIRCPKGIIYVPVEKCSFRDGFIYHMSEKKISGKSKNSFEHDEMIDDLLIEADILASEIADRYRFESTVQRRYDLIMEESSQAIKVKKELKKIISEAKMIKSNLMTKNKRQCNLDCIAKIVLNKIKTLRKEVNSLKESIRRNVTYLIINENDIYVKEVLSEVRTYNRELAKNEVMDLFKQTAITIKKGEL